MSQIRTSSLFAMLAVLGLCALAGCGNTNSQSVFDSTSGAHVAGWVPLGHSQAAAANIDSCTDCHGADFAGGIAKVSCTSCHLGDQQHVHPLTWGNFAYALHPGYVAQNGTAACANALCHGATLTGVTTSGPSCTSCHLGGVASVHPSGWNTAADLNPNSTVPPHTPLHGQYAVASGTGSCRNAVCHGSNLQGVLLSGPPCAQCHPGVTFH